MTVQDWWGLTILAFGIGVIVGILAGRTWR